MVLGYLTYEVFHACEHLPEKHPLSRLPWIRQMRRLHELHHRREHMQERNFNIVLPLMDYLFGTLYREPEPIPLTDSRTPMESLLQRIVDTGSEIAIIDITGVPTVDTLVAQHLLKTVTAIRLMGADCIISGVRPQIAQTIVHLGLDLQGVVTKANLADALKLALTRLGITLTKTV